ncbi:hypothetical protein BGZ52_009579 [Haplosporangium bisporale]|nr:hypothetical protein BGZ52_009579 [Haplosporangium bisporale]
MHNGDSTRDNSDHILLLPASQPQSQVSTPSVATVPSFLNDNGSNISNFTSTPSISLSHRGPTVPPDSHTGGGSSTSVQIPISSINHGGDSGHPSSSTAANSSVSLNYGATSQDDHGHPLTFFQKYIIAPAHSFKAYLASSDRESAYRNSRIPPWLLPRYHGRKPVLRSTIFRPLCRLLLLAVITAVLIASTIVYSFRDGQPQLSDYAAVTEFDWPPIQPRSYLSPMNSTFGNYDVLLDGHSHSTYSDGRMSPETLIKWHIANGFNAVIVTDHNTIEGGLAAQKIGQEKYADQITVIPGMELSCCRLHMNLIGINETIDIAITKWPTDDQLKATIQRTHDLGGLAIINHIPWSNTTEYGYELPRMQNHPSREALVEMGIDGFEIVNSGTLDTISLKFIQDNNLLLMTGTDVHYPDTGAFGWTILNTNNNRSQDSIMAQLRARQTSFLFDPTGTQPVAYPPESADYYKTAPPTLLGQYFQMFWLDQTGMYSFSPEGGFCHEEFITIRWKLIGYFVAWMLVGFLLFEAARLLVVGCCWGPYQRRRKFKRKQRMLEREQGRDHMNDEDDLGA